MTIAWLLLSFYLLHNKWIQIFWNEYNQSSFLYMNKGRENDKKLKNLKMGKREESRIFVFFFILSFVKGRRDDLFYFLLTTDDLSFVLSFAVVGDGTFFCILFTTVYAFLPFIAFILFRKEEKKSFFLEERWSLIFFFPPEGRWPRILCMTILVTCY